MTAVERFTAYLYDQHCMAKETLRQCNPMTADGYGLDCIASAIKIFPRFEAETDVQLRERIYCELRSTT